MKFIFSAVIICLSGNTFAKEAGHWETKIVAKEAAYAEPFIQDLMNRWDAFKGKDPVNYKSAGITVYQSSWSGPTNCSPGDARLQRTDNSIEFCMKDYNGVPGLCVVGGISIQPDFDPCWSDQ